MSTFLSYQGSNTLPAAATRSELSNAGWNVVSLARSGGTVTTPVWYAFTFCPGVVGIAYSQQFDLSPAASPTAFTVLTGSLPTGLALSNPGGDGNEGLISGTPTVAGTYNFTLRATNAYGTDDKALSIVITTASGGGSYCFAA